MLAPLGCPADLAGAVRPLAVPASETALATAFFAGAAPVPEAAFLAAGAFAGAFFAAFAGVADVVFAVVFLAGFFAAGEPEGSAPWVPSGSTTAALLLVTAL